MYNYACTVILSHPISARNNHTVQSFYKKTFSCSSLQHVIDGDLCEMYNTLEPAKQASIAEELDKTPNDVAKKLEEIRTKYAF